MRPLSIASSITRRTSDEVDFFECAVDDTGLGFWNEIHDDSIYEHSGVKRNRDIERPRSLVATPETVCRSVRRSVLRRSLPSVSDETVRDLQEFEDSVSALTPSSSDISEAQIQLVHSRRVLQVSQPSATAGDNTRNKRHALYLEGLEPDFNPVTRTFVFHNPLAGALVAL